MLNVNDLEIRHKKYKIKSYIPYFTIFAGVTIALISIASFFLYNSKVEISSEIEEQKQPIIIQKIEAIHETKEKNETAQEVALNKIEKTIAEPAESKNDVKIEQKQEKVVLSPSLGFMNKMSSNGQTNITNEIISNNKGLPKEVIIEVKQKEVEPKVEPKKIEKIEEISLNIDKKNPINISRKDEQEDVLQVIKRFNVNHNPALSLFVAKKYYQLGNYEQAYNYALITNEINNNIEESWIIFSKSLVKINKKEEAIETLKKYISHSHSSQAKQLLDEISSGKFK